MAAMADPWDQLSVMSSSCQKSSESLMNGTMAAPFDQGEWLMLCTLSRQCRRRFFVEFYLILNLAVGGTNGWFPDEDGKPWLDGSESEDLSFAAEIHRLQISS